LHPNVTLNRGPLGVVECRNSNRSQARTHLNRVCDSGAAARAELEPQPPAALVGAMLVGVEFSLQQRYVCVIEIGDRRESRSQPTLTEPAVTDLANFRISQHLIAHGATGTTAFMKSAHWFLRAKISIGMTWPFVKPRDMLAMASFALSPWISITARYGGLPPLATIARACAPAASASSRLL